MPLDKSSLLGLLEAVDDELTRKITLVAAGGTAIQDIESCIKKFKLEKSQVSKRARMVQYAGNEMVYETNLQYVLKSFFTGKSKKDRR
jgi:hypothetical protein